MNVTDHESIAAECCLQLAQAHANTISMPEDNTAATVAILMLALELATPELSRDKRAQLFNGDDE